MNQKNKLLSNHNFNRKRLFILFAPIFAVITIIVIIPTIVVHLSSQDRNDIVHDNIDNGQTVFSETNLNEPLIKVSITRHETGEVETIPLEEYVASVVASEMPTHFALDALKAQAIAARTYIVNHLLHEQDKLITDTTEHQVYRSKEELQTMWGTDFHWKWAKVWQAVEETEHIILTYNDQPITPTFFSMSNGYTEDAKHYWGNDLPYLKSVKSKWEETLPNFISQEIFTIGEIKEKLGITINNNLQIPIQIKRTPSNRVSEITINSTTLTGRDVREKLNLRSTDFTVKQKNDHLIFTTKGYGHGVGMSQYGADGMAKEGKSYEEILSYYYKGVKLTEITESVPSLLAANE